MLGGEEVAVCSSSWKVHDFPKGGCKGIVKFLEERLSDRRGTESIGETWQEKCTDGVKFLPWS